MTRHLQAGAGGGRAEGVGPLEHIDLAVRARLCSLLLLLLFFFLLLLMSKHRDAGE
jgi:hypothetical protein